MFPGRSAGRRCAAASSARMSSTPTRTGVAAKGPSGINVTLSSRERLVLIEPRGGGLLMSTLRSADEVRAAEFADATDASGIDPDMLSIAETIIERRKGAFDPVDFR